MHSTLIERALKVKMMVFDVDGVLTDGRLYISEEGIESKSFNILDGQGIKMLMASGVQVGIMSTRESKAVEVRARDLGVEHLFQGLDNKMETFLDLMNKLGFEKEQTGYMGDDIVDIPMMRRCGLSVAVPNSPILVREAAHYVTTTQGGMGAVREACEFIMQVQGTYDRQIARYLTI